MSTNIPDNQKFTGRVKDIGGKGLHAGLDSLSGFQKFLLRGNVIDLAVGVVIGAAFNGLVQGFVIDLLQPLVGVIISQFTGQGVQSLNNYKTGPFLWGAFISLFISFLLTAAAVYFFVVKPINLLHDRYDHIRHKADTNEILPTTRECPRCLSTIPRAASRCSFCTSEILPLSR